MDENDGNDVTTSVSKRRRMILDSLKLVDENGDLIREDDSVFYRVH